MVKFFKRLFRLFTIKSNNLIKKHEDAIEIYEHELKKSRENLDKIGESQSKLRSQKRLVEDKEKAAVEKIGSLQAILDRAVEQNDDTLGEEAISLIDKNEKNIEMYRVNIESYDNVIAQLDEQYASLKDKLNDKASKLDGLKAQNEFAKNMETINSELKNHYSEDEFDFTSFEKIEEDLKGKIYLEQDRNTRFTPELSLEDRVEADSRKSKFQEYKEKKLSEQAEG